MADKVTIEGLVSDAEEGQDVGYRTFGGEAEEVSTQKPEQPGEEVQEDEEVSDEVEDEEPEDVEEEEDEEEFLVDVPKELEEDRANLHRVYMTKLKELAGVRSQAALVEQLNRDPQRVIMNLAQRYGVQLQQPQQQQQAKETPKFEPKVSEPREGENQAQYIQRLITESLGSLPDFIQQTITSAIQGNAAQQQTPTPVQQQEDVVKGVISYLDDKYTDWPMYEKEMVELVTKYPAYASNPDDLYNQAKRNHQASSTKATKVASKQKGRKSVARAKTKVKTKAKPKGRTTFDQAWDAAKADLLSKE